MMKRAVTGQPAREGETTRLNLGLHVGVSVLTNQEGPIASVTSSGRDLSLRRASEPAVERDYGGTLWPLAPHDRA
jgi:hypothetical protein